MPIRSRSSFVRPASSIAALLLLMLPNALVAQTGDGTGSTPAGGTPGEDRVLVDGVAAVVGNEIVLVSDVLQRAQLYAQQSHVDAKDPKLQRQLLNDLIDEKLVLTRAHEDSITVSDEMVDQRLEYQMQQLVHQAGSEARLEQAYGMSMARLRQQARELIRQQLLIQKIVQKKFGDLKVTDHDMDEYFRSNRDSLESVRVPEQVELRQILLTPTPGEETMQKTVDLLNSIRDSVLAGGDFSDFARRYSQDPGSASEGGDLGYVKPGTFVSAFDKAVAGLSVNEISKPVKTEFGYHLIQLLDRRSDGQIHVRHILIKPTVSTTERDSLMAQLDRIEARVRGGESFAELARTYSQDPQTAPVGGLIGKLPVTQLSRTLSGRIPPAEIDSLKTLPEGGMIGPVEEQISPTESGYGIIQVSRRVAAHTFDPTEDRAQLEQLAMLDKQQQRYKEWVDKLRTEIYWKIKTDPTELTQ